MNTRKVTLLCLCIITLLIGGATTKYVWGGVSFHPQSVEIGLLALSANDKERGYAVPASGHSATDCTTDKLGNVTCPPPPTPPPPSPTPTPSPTPPPPVTSSSPTLSLELLSPATAYVGQVITLEWTSTNTDTCVASGAWSGGKATNNVEDITVTTSGTQTYVLECSGPGGPSAIDSVAVTTIEPMVMLSVNREIVRAGDSVEVRWNIEPWDLDPAAACTITGLTNEMIVVTSGTGRADSSAITNGRRITLSCVIFGYTYTDEEFVEVIPTVLEF